MEDVAIIGVGMHAFGRFGAKSAIDMAAEAVRAACADAGVQWPDVQFAFGGSYTVDNPDAVIGRLGLTGIPFMDVYNGCATAATALELTADAIRSGKYDIGVAVGMDKHDAGAFTADPVDYSAPAWYGEMGYFLTTKFFGMKINRYMHDHGISHETLGRVAAKAFRNGALNPNAFRRRPVPVEDIGGAHPGRGAHRRGVTGRVRRGGHRSLRRGRGAAAGHRRRGRDHPHGRERLLRRRRAGEADRRGCDRDRWVAAGQHRRRADRQRGAGRRLRVAASARAGAAAAWPGRRAPGAGRAATR